MLPRAVKPAAALRLGQVWTKTSDSEGRLCRMCQLPLLGAATFAAGQLGVREPSAAQLQPTKSEQRWESEHRSGVPDSLTPDLKRLTMRPAARAATLQHTWSQT